MAQDRRARPRPYDRTPLGAPSRGFVHRDGPPTLRLDTRRSNEVHTASRGYARTFPRKSGHNRSEEQLRNYKKLRELVETWATLGMELSQLQQQRERSVRPAARTRKRRAAPA